MELKPCPFCGSEVHLKAVPLWRPGGHGYYGCYEYIVQCDNIECGCRLTNLGKKQHDILIPGRCGEKRRRSVEQEG